jgi:hypothetical protein
MSVGEHPAATPSGHTTNQWLIERGQPEGEQNAVWLEHTGIHPATEGRWTRNAWDAAMFPDKATAESYIAERGLEARAVEHGFMHEPTREEKLTAAVEGLLSVGERSRSGDPTLNPEEWYAIRDYARRVLNDAD